MSCGCRTFRHKDANTGKELEQRSFRRGMNWSKSRVLFKGPTPLFCKKRLQVIANKGKQERERCKETGKRRQASENTKVERKAEVGKSA